MFQLRLEKENVFDTVMRLSLNRQSPKYQKIFKLFCEMAKKEQTHRLSRQDVVILQTTVIFFLKRAVLYE